MASSDIIAEIAKTISDRRRLYDAAYTGDLDRLRPVHGPGPVLEALQTLERRPNSSTWDANGHRGAVRAGVASVLRRRRDDPESFPDDGVTV